LEVANDQAKPKC